MLTRLTVLVVLSAVLLAFFSTPVCAQSAGASSKPNAPPLLFAVEIKVGPNWDQAKAPNEQAFFAEHSARLKKLRDAGHIVMGARYSDIGLLIVSAESSEAVDQLMQQDPSMAAGTFVYAIHAFRPFYPWVQ